MKYEKTKLKKCVKLIHRQFRFLIFNSILAQVDVLEKLIPYFINKKLYKNTDNMTDLLILTSLLI